jgi:hypothetical protein
MLDKLTGKPIHYTVHVIACFGIAIGLPWSKVPLSLATFLMAFNFVLAADFKTAISRWKKSPVLLFFLAYLLMECISLSWTKDFHYALSDIRVKLPLIILPLVIVGIPLKTNRIKNSIFLAFLGSLFLTSFLNIGTYLQWWGNAEFDDIRSLSLFGSHIRYALQIVLGMVLSIRWLSGKYPFKWIPTLLIIWFLWYTYFSQIVAGYVALIAVIVMSTFYLIHQFSQPKVKLIIVSTFFIGGVTFSFWTYQLLQPVPHKVSLDRLPLKTKLGHTYTRDARTIHWENGYPIIAQICDTEIEPLWNRFSKIDYQTGLDHKGTSIHFTLWRYMASKGLAKDAEGFHALSNSDIQNVEKGIASVLLTQGGLKARLYSIQFQLQNPDNPNGHSMLQRLEFWKAAVAIIRSNWVVGVGMGDVQQSFYHYYNINHSKLLPENRHRAHNQFLTAWISSGIFGFLFFMLWWWSQLHYAWKIKSYEWLCFTVICLSSFLTEDTLETQVGLTFIAFFFSLFSQTINTASEKAVNSKTLIKN